MLYYSRIEGWVFLDLRMDGGRGDVIDRQRRLTDLTVTDAGR